MQRRIFKADEGLQFKWSQVEVTQVVSPVHKAGIVSMLPDAKNWEFSLAKKDVQ